MSEGGRGGIGSRKHGKSGRSGKSPKLRHAMKREAEADERKADDRTVWSKSVAEALARGNRSVRLHRA